MRQSFPADLCLSVVMTIRILVIPDLLYLSLTFRLDNWIGDGTLKDSFSWLYHPDKVKKCLVSDRVRLGGPSWEWRAQPSTNEKVCDLDNISSLTVLFQPSIRPNSCICGVASDGLFRVNANKTQNLLTPISLNVTHVIWIHEVTIKVTSFI